MCRIVAVKIYVGSRRMNETSPVGLQMKRLVYLGCAANHNSTKSLVQVVPRRIPTNISSYCLNKWTQLMRTLLPSPWQCVAVYRLHFTMRISSSEILTGSFFDGTFLAARWPSLVFTQRKGSIVNLMLLDTKTKEVRALHAPSFGELPWLVTCIKWHSHTWSQMEIYDKASRRQLDRCVQRFRDRFTPAYQRHGL